MASFINDTLDGPPLPFIASTAPKDASIVESNEVRESESPKNEHHNGVSELHPAAGAPNAKLLISSPYLELHHQLDLSTLDAQSALFARSLAVLDSATTVYATSEYTDALTWSAVVAHLRKLCAEQNHTWTQQAFYVVAFYSKLKEGADRNLLQQLDKESHAEAAKSGGLLKYWFGSPNEQRRNLATCKFLTNPETTLDAVSAV